MPSTSDTFVSLASIAAVTRDSSVAAVWISSVPGASGGNCGDGGVKGGVMGGGECGGGGAAGGGGLSSDTAQQPLHTHPRELSSSHVKAWSRSPQVIRLQRCAQLGLGGAGPAPAPGKANPPEPGSLLSPEPASSTWATTGANTHKRATPRCSRSMISRHTKT
eukprot:917371-Prymnesium_polylepis.3